MILNFFIDKIYPANKLSAKKNPSSANRQTCLCIGMSRYQFFLTSGYMDILDTDFFFGYFDVMHFFQKIGGLLLITNMKTNTWGMFFFDLEGKNAS